VYVAVQSENRCTIVSSSTPQRGHVALVGVKWWMRRLTGSAFRSAKKNVYDNGAQMGGRSRMAAKLPSRLWVHTIGTVR